MANIIEQIVRIVTDGEETRAEVVGELVRCKDCKHYWKNDGELAVCLASPKDDAFCSEGVRKEIEDATN